VIDYPSFWNIYNKDRDFIVLPEPLGPQIQAFPGKKVIFNKSLYYGFRTFGAKRDAYDVYADETVAAVFAVSDHNLSHLRFAFPGIKLFRVYTHIDCQLFRYREPAQKKKKIACVLKAKEPLTVLYQMLRSRSRQGLNRLSEYEWVFLQGYSLEQIAEILQDALILISLNTCEGLPRTVLEGLACGCLVFGYGKGPLEECLPLKSRFEPDDLLTMSQSIERILNSFPVIGEAWAESSNAGRCVAETFSLERQRDHLIAAWEEILQTYEG